MNPFNPIWYGCSMLAGTDTTDTLPLHDTICQYMVSIVVHLVCAAILFTVHGHLSIIPFPAGLYAQHGQNHMVYSFKNYLNFWPKAMSLVARSLLYYVYSILLKQQPPD